MLSGNDLGQLANIEFLPDDDSIDRAREINANKSDETVHQIAKALIAEDKIEEALAILMAMEA